MIPNHDPEATQEEYSDGAFQRASTATSSKSGEEGSPARMVPEGTDWAEASSKLF